MPIWYARFLWTRHLGVFSLLWQISPARGDTRHWDGIMRSGENKKSKEPRNKREILDWEMLFQLHALAC